MMPIVVTPEDAAVRRFGFAASVDSCQAAASTELAASVDVRAGDSVVGVADVISKVLDGAR